MDFGMYQQQRMELSQRQKMEQRVEQAMRQMQLPRMEMRLYQTREDALRTLYAAAAARGDVVSYARHDLRFSYARVRRAEVPGDVLAACGWGFAHCLYDSWERLFAGRDAALARGDWLLFVVPDYFAPVEVPASYIEYVAVHEHGEECTLGRHDLATRLEFAVCQAERGVPSYVAWYEEHAPNKFADLFANQARVVLPDSAEFQQLLELRQQSDYAQRVRGWMEVFAWPYRMLQKLSLYERRSRELELLLTDSYTQLASLLGSFQGTETLTQTFGAVTLHVRSVLQKLKARRRFLCFPRTAERYQEVRKAVVYAYDQYREKRIGVLGGGDRVRGMEMFISESQLPGAATEIPADGLFSSLLDEALAAV